MKPSAVLGGLKAVVSERDLLSDSKVCRICLEEDEMSGDNPFIEPCGCVGSVRWIHVKCVREWLDAKKQQQRVGGVYSYYWEELACELCKEPLKLRNKVVIRSKDGSYKYQKEFCLLNYKVPVDGRYMVLESDINCVSKAIHVLNFDVK